VETLGDYYIIKGNLWHTYRIELILPRMSKFLFFHDRPMKFNVIESIESENFMPVSVQGNITCWILVQYQRISTSI
jgi:hypothetical protein